MVQTKQVFHFFYFYGVVCAWARAHAWRGATCCLQSTETFISLLFTEHLLSFSSMCARDRGKRAVGGANLGASGGTRCSHYNDNRKESARAHTHTQSHFLSHSRSCFLPVCLSISVCLSPKQTDCRTPPPLTGGLPQLSCCPPLDRYM